MLKIFNPQVLSRLLYNAPDRSGKTLRQTSKLMGESETYLSRQLNPDDPGAKLGIEDFVYLTAVTDLEALDYIEQCFGRVAINLPDKTTNTPFNWLHNISSISKQAGECISTFTDALANGEMTHREARHCEKITYDAIQALSQIWFHLKEYTPVNDSRVAEKV